MNKSNTSLLQYKSIPSKLVIPILLIVPNIIFWTGILVQDGTIIQRDFNFPLFNQNFEESYFPLWSDVISQSNIERFPRLVLMSPFIILSILGIEISLILKIMVISAFGFATTTTYLFATALLRRYNIKRGKTIWIKSISLIGAYIFAYSPASMQFSWEISFIASMAILPLMLYLIISKPTSRYLPFFLASCLLFSLAHPFFFIMNILISIIFMFVVNYRTITLHYTLSRILLTTLLAIPLLAWLWMPYLASPISSIELGRDEHLERNIFDTVSDNDLYRILFLERDKFAYVHTSPDEPFARIFHYASIALLIAGSFACFLLTRRWIPKTMVLFFAGGFLTLSMLSLGGSGPLGELYWLFLSESGIGWIFRSPLKFQLYQAFFLSILFIISIAMIRQKIYPKILVGIFMMLVLVGSSYYGIYHAVTASINPIAIPREYYLINSYLERNAAESKVLYLPRYNELSTVWSQGHMIAPFDMKSSQMSTYDTYLGYNFVKETLYDYPFTKGLLKSMNFYELLSSVGIRYIVFHNDRGYSIDQRNLEFLLNSQQLNLLFEENNWYLFELKAGEMAKIRAIHDIAQVNDISSRFDIASPSIAVVDSSSSAKIREQILEGDYLVKFVRSNNTSEVSLENKIQDPDFNDLDRNAPPSWNWHVTGFKVVKNFDEITDTNYLQISTDLTTKNTWSWLLSQDLDVSTGDKYLFAVDVKTVNAYGTHIKIQGLNKSENLWEDILFVTSGDTSSTVSINGDSDWTSYWKTLEIPSGISKIRFVINAGSVVDEEAGSAQTLARKPGVYNLGDLVREGNDSKVEYTKVSSTHYKVNIHSNSPFVLAITEAYDSGWVAIDEHGNKLQSMPLYGMINGFYFSRTGDYAVSLKYEPQEFFNIGASAAAVTLVGTILYLTLPWFRVIDINISNRIPRFKITIFLIKLFEQRNRKITKMAAGAESNKNISTLCTTIANQNHKHIPCNTVQASFVNHKKYLISNNSFQENKFISRLTRSDSSDLPILIALSLVVILPFLIVLDSAYLNLIAAYALGCLTIGLVWKSIPSSKNIDQLNKLFDKMHIGKWI